MNNLTTWPEIAETCPNCPHIWGEHVVNKTRAITCPDCDCRSLIAHPAPEGISA